MAAGDVVLKVSGTLVDFDTSDREGTLSYQCTELLGGTVLGSAFGTSGIYHTVSVVKTRRDSSTGGSADETCFLGGKKYTITITED